MSNKAIGVLSIIATIVLILVGITWFTKHGGMNNSNYYMKTNVPLVFNTHQYAKNIIKPKEGQPIKKFSLVAMENINNIKQGLNLPVWTYNGKVPGQEIRVTEGDFIKVELKNALREPVTIHWHGYPLKSAMDGVPGLNQDSVMPGETFTYEFSADVPGTYWYHSHQEGAKQVDKGLYGALVVEPKIKLKIDKDFTLIFDEWQENPTEDMDSMPGMGNMNMETNKNLTDSEETMMSDSYNIYTVNGKSGNLISPLNVKKGETVRLRLINAGYRSHGIHIPEQEIKVVSTDGQNIKDAQNIKDNIILVAPGERYDVEFIVNSDDSFIIDAHDSNKFNSQLKIPVNVINGSGKVKTENSESQLTVFDVTKYGATEKGTFSLDQKYDIEYNVDLNTKEDNNGLKYTINGKIFNELQPLRVKTGNIIKFTFINKSSVDHPMHLHGHFFQVLSKNDEVVNSVIMKDTLLVRPGERYVVAFKADNTGNWVQHCHELHHAAAGMMQKIEYEDFIPNYISNPNNKFNRPE